MYRYLHFLSVYACMFSYTSVFVYTFEFTFQTYTKMHVRKYTCILAYVQLLFKYRPKRRRMYIRTHTRDSCTHELTFSNTYTYMPTHTHKCACACTHTHVLSYIRMLTYLHIYACMYKYMHISALVSWVSMHSCERVSSMYTVTRVRLCVYTCLCMRYTCACAIECVCECVYVRAYF